MALVRLVYVGDDPAKQAFEELDMPVVPDVGDTVTVWDGTGVGSEYSVHKRHFIVMVGRTTRRQHEAPFVILEVQQVLLLSPDSRIA